MSAGMKKVVSTSFEQTLAELPRALAAEGFGVLTEIDVQQTLAQKLQVPFRRYRILGACNPTLAYRALSTELDAGVMLPCNVVIYEGDAGQAVVVAIDPLQTLAGEPGALREVAQQVREKLGRVLARLDGAQP